MKIRNRFRVYNIVEFSLATAFLKIFKKRGLEISAV